MFRLNRFKNIATTCIRRTYKSSSCELLSAISDLRQFDIHLKNFPSVVVFGPQSSGKSSLVEALIDQRLLPTDMGMATRKPTHITTLRSDKKEYQIGDRVFQANDVIAASNEINRLNRNDYVKEIYITVKSPKVHNCTIIDLPGLYQISSDNDNNDEMRRSIRNMTTTYTANTNCIPLLVHASPSDPATNAGLKIITKNNRRPDSICALTKFDMILGQNHEYLDKMLNGQEYKLGHGYCAVILSTDADVRNGISIDDKINVERQYFKKNYPAIQMAGVPVLREMLSKIQSEKIVENLNQIIHEVDLQIASLQNSNNFLTDMMSGSNEKLSRNLRVMIEKLVGSSQERALFEAELKNLIKSRIIQHLGEIENKSEKLQSTNTFVDESIVSLHRNSKTTFNPENQFKQLFCHGSGTPVFIDNQILTQAYEKEMTVGLAMQLIEPYINDNLGMLRVKWNRQLNDYFGKLLENDAIHNIIREVTFSQLLKYIITEAEMRDPISQKFAEYMIGEIGNEAFESKIKYSITAMLNLEKRPIVSVFEIVRELLAEYPEILKMPRGFFINPRLQKYKLEIFSEEFSHAYSKVVINKLAENSYRNVVVNLLDKMVEKLLQMIIDMFHHENAVKEQNKVQNKINKLVEIRKILVSFEKIEN